MSIDSLTSATASTDGGSVADYFELLKPRVMSLVIFTALAGMVCAPGQLHPVLAVIALLCIAAGAGASGALNMWYDADIDALMARTIRRPIPDGRIEPTEALVFGLVLSGASVVVLAVTVSWFAAALLAMTIVYYVVVYTMWLKRRTVQNIVIGGAAGAFPPMIGYAAVSNTITIDSVLMFAIIFLWTPPHFWALALNRSGDYARAGVPMLPVVSGPDATRLQILLYSLVMAPVGVLPVVTGLGGIAYGIAAVVAGLIFVWLAAEVFRKRTGDAAVFAARRLFRFSLIYLALLFAVLLAEHLMTALTTLWVH